MVKLPFDIPEGMQFNSLEEVNAYIQKQMDRVNNQPLDQFDGLSPEQMHRLIGRSMTGRPGIEIKKLSAENLARIPVFSTLKYYLKLLNEGEIKLSASGNLPSKVVVDIYSKGYFKEWTCDRKTRILETDSLLIQLVRIVASLAKWTKVRTGKLSITKEGLKIQQDDNELFRAFLECWLYRFNWAYFDSYESEDVGRQNFEYSFYLLHKYGNEWRESVFYAKKYFEAFPMLENQQTKPKEINERFYPYYSCYTVRTFERLLVYLNAVEFADTKWNEVPRLKKTELFDLIF